MKRVLIGDGSTRFSNAGSRWAAGASVLSSRPPRRTFPHWVKPASRSRTRPPSRSRRRRTSHPFAPPTPRVAHRVLAAGQRGGAGGLRVDAFAVRTPVGIRADERGDRHRSGHQGSKAAVAAGGDRSGGTDAKHAPDAKSCGGSGCVMNRGQWRRLQTSPGSRPDICQPNSTAPLIVTIAPGYALSKTAAS